jgi:protein gp37
VSIEDQETANERCKILQAVPAALRFIAAEPLLGMVQIGKFLRGRRPFGWVIAGGESGIDARPMRPSWVRSLRDECQEYEKPFFLHQWGAWLPVNTGQLKEHCNEKSVLYFWPDGEMQVHLQKSDIKTMQDAGITLDGVEWSQKPEIK